MTTPSHGPGQSPEPWEAAVAHDIKTPLASLRLLIHLLKREASGGVASPERVTQRLNHMDQHVKRISAMVGELLDVARLQSGETIELHRAEVDLGQLVRDALSRVEEDFPLHVLKLDAPDRPIVGLWDASRLERVLTNILINAARYSPPESMVLVRVRAPAAAGYAVIEVADRGLGIPAQDLPHVLEWFRRGGNVAHIPGSGVGLPGAKHIVTMHGGSFEIESQEGRGATVRIRLPLRPGLPLDDPHGGTPVVEPARAPTADEGRITNHPD